MTREVFRRDGQGMHSSLTVNKTYVFLTVDKVFSAHPCDESASCFEQYLEAERGHEGCENDDALKPHCGEASAVKIEGRETTEM